MRGRLETVAGMWFREGRQVLVRIDHEALPLTSVVARYHRKRGHSVGGFDSVPNVPNVGADLTQSNLSWLR